MEDEYEMMLMWGAHAVSFQRSFTRPWSAPIGDSRITLKRTEGPLYWRAKCSIFAVECSGETPQGALDALGKRMKWYVERMQTVVRGV